MSIWEQKTSNNTEAIDKKLAATNAKLDAIAAELKKLTEALAQVVASR